MSVWQGFAQSCEFLKKSWNLASNLPDLEKVWKMEIKFGKRSKVVSFSFCNFKSEICFVLVRSYSISTLCLQCIVKKISFLHFFKKWKVCIDHLFDNLESGKINYCFGKKSGKSLEFSIQKSVPTMCNRSDLFFFFFYYSVLLFFHKPNHFKKEKSTKSY